MNTLHYYLMADHSHFHKALFASIKSTGLTSGQPKVLDYLADNDGAVQKDIAAGCCIEPATLTNLLNGMEKEKLLERKTIDGNRRSYHIFLTPKGKTLCEIIRQEFMAIEYRALDGFTSEEKQLLNTYLDRIHTNMKEGL